MGSINTAFIKQYDDNLMMLVQQEGSVLRNTVLVDTDFKGEYKFYDQLGTMTSTKLSSRHQVTPITDPDHQRRRVSKENYVVNTVYDWQDDINMLLDPTNSYVKANAMRLGRDIDSVILAAAVGTAYSGQDGGTSTTLASYDSGSHVITATSGLTIAKLREVKKLLMLADVSSMEDFSFVGSFREIDNLLGTLEATSADFNSVKSLVNGDVKTFMGMNFVYTNQVTRATGVDTCVAYAKSGIQLAISLDLATRIDERPDLNYAKQVYSRMSLGAVRLEEAKVVQISVTNA